MFLITIETARIVTVPKLVAPRSPDSGSSRRRRSPLRRSSKVSANHSFTSPTVGVAKRHAARVVVHLDQADVEPTPDKFETRDLFERTATLRARRWVPQSDVVLS